MTKNFKRTALIDNDALANLTHVPRIFSLMRNLFFRLEIPTEIKNEYEQVIHFEPQRRQILDQLKPNTGFWSLCTELELLSIVFLFDYKGIDKGEAELVSQGEKKVLES